MLSPRRNVGMRNPVRSDGKHPVPVELVKDVSKTLGFEFILRGPSGNAGGAITSATATEVGDVLDTVLGAATDPSGAATTATGGTGATPNVTVASGTNVANGVVCAFLTDGVTAPIVRQVESGGGTGTLVLDRTYTGTVTAGGVFYRGPRWSVAPATHELTHSFLRGEADNRMREFFGCMAALKIDLAVGQYARLMADFNYTDVQDAAEANPTFTGPTSGNAVVTSNNKLFIGNDQFMALDLAVDFGGAVKPRVANSGPHGVQGYTVERAGDNPLPKITGKMYLGTNSTLGEVADSANTFRSNYAQGWDKSAGENSTSWDIALQAGNVIGGIAYFRARAGVFTGWEEISIDGKDGVQFEITCFDPSSGAPLDISLL
jgi:hypothetical protein